MSHDDWELLVAPDFAGDVAHYSKPDGEGGLLIRSTQRFDTILEANKAELTSGHDGFNADRDRKKVATIPMLVRQYFLEREGWDPWKPHLYPERMARLLNDPDWAWLRTSSGRVAATNGILR